MQHISICLSNAPSIFLLEFHLSHSKTPVGLNPSRLPAGSNVVVKNATNGTTTISHHSRHWAFDFDDTTMSSQQECGQIQEADSTE
mmetsp:Transcript_25173/g.41497  ORF Transcript_25173/g.41497 Transcript_25173/m.41497 type:complete len:86 (-) Transcript_25173:273-530(-)